MSCLLALIGMYSKVIIMYLQYYKTVDFICNLYNAFSFIRCDFFTFQPLAIILINVNVNNFWRLEWACYLTVIRFFRNKILTNWYFSCCNLTLALDSSSQLFLVLSNLHWISVQQLIYGTICFHGIICINEKE